MQLYYITDRNLFPGSPADRKRSLLAKIAECVAAGVDYIQLREKDLGGRELCQLAEEAMRLIPSGARTRLLINSRVDIALACGAHGVHLPANALRALDARAVFNTAGKSDALIVVSTHSVEEVVDAHEQKADFVVFGPVFEKNSAMSADGLAKLGSACAISIPVFALGGVTVENVGQCREKGAAGVAGIRLFQQGRVAEIPGSVR
jgi:thiamine-phosphate pyrophosphorylase